MSTYRVYHPETGEPFDVPKHRFDELVLNQGWLQTPPERKPSKTSNAKSDAAKVFKRRRKEPVEEAPDPEGFLPTDEASAEE